VSGGPDAGYFGQEALTMWNRNEIEGKGDRLKGRAKQEAGEILNDEKLREEGAADEASGNVQETLGKGRRKVGEAIKDIGNAIKR
jgi:uncharacterized protein YjbJ (UPF0337 family)